MSDMKLYEITSEYALKLEEALDIAAENNGEIPAELSDEMDQLSIDKDEKIDCLIRIYKNELSIASAIEAEIKSLKDRMKSHDNKAEWIKKYIRENMQEGEKKELSCGKIGWRNSSSVEIMDESKLPESVWKIEKEVSKTKVKELIESGLITGDVARMKNSINMNIK